ncbi:MAG: 3-hydroxyacyl-CoA dehydrogenase NAD-binding domain-containing protein, partial [Dehalococcoidia bacterium]
MSTVGPGEQRRKTGETASPRDIVRRAAVLGAGTMGAQIAALLANQGIPCDLLDLATDAADQSRNRLAEEGKERLLKVTPSPVFGGDVLDLITPGNFSDDLPRLREADWVIEAVVERLDVKQA